MILAFPLLIVCSFLCKEFFSEGTHKKVPIVIGFLLAAVYTFIDLFFTSAYYLTPYAFMPNFMYSFIYDIAIPLGISALFLLVFIKAFHFKWNELYYIALGFFVVYFPARIMNTNITLDWYDLFVKPLIFCSMLFGLKNVVAYTYALFNKKDVEKNKLLLIRVIVIVAYIVCIMFPNAIDAFEAIGMPEWFLLVLMIFYCSGIIIGSIVLRKKIII